jgi:hypothetical protein
MLLAALLLAQLTITTIPPAPLIEDGKSQQLVNFDLLVTNGTNEKLELESVEATLLGPNGEVVAQKRVDTNGDSTTSRAGSW